MTICQGGGGLPPHLVMYDPASGELPCAVTGVHGITERGATVPLHGSGSNDRL